MRERDMENSPSDSATLSGDVTRPVGEPEIGAASGAGPQAEPGGALEATPSSSKTMTG